MDENKMRSLIDPELLANYDASPGFDLFHLEEFKKSSYEQEKANLKDDPEVTVYEKMIPGPKGAPDIKLRIYEPAGRGVELLPCGLYFHGGGYVFGSVLRQNDLCVRMAKNEGMMVI